MNVQVNAFTSFKLLLKQVYSAHTARVKELENEVQVLKEQMSIKIKESESISDCKRCAELESAFKSCKKSLEEQSKFFDSFGKRYSIFKDSQERSLESQSSQSSYKTGNVKDNVDVKTSSRTETTSLPLQDSIFDDINVAKVFSTSSNQNLFKKFMLDDENRGTFDVCTVTFPQELNNDINYNKKFDETIFAPDSVDIGFDSKKGIKRRSNDSFSEGDKAKKTTNAELKNNKKESEIIRRQSFNSSHKSSLKKSYKNAKSDVDVKESVYIDIHQIKTNSLKEQNSKFNADKNKVDSSAKNIDTELKTTESVEAEILKEKKNITPKNSFSSGVINNVSKSENPCDTPSPSLLPKSNALVKKINLDAIVNDNDDFIENASSSSSKSNQSDDCPEINNKQKMLKKTRPRIKCSSKYKMTLDAPPLDYKKTNFKQSKLSRSFFQGKNKGGCDGKVTGQIKDLCPKNANEPIPIIVLDEFQTSTPCDASRTTDIDATFIPDNYKIDVTSFGTTNVEKNAAEKSNLRNGSLFSNISFLEDLKPKSGTGDNEILNSPSSEDPEFKENMNSFDRLPVPEEPYYKYKNDVVRKKAERKLLDGFDCKECEKYYSDLGLSDKEKKERMKKCSRHRGKFAPPATPDHFWELDFPDTEECKLRGYMDATQKVKLNQLGDK